MRVRVTDDPTRFGVATDSMRERNGRLYRSVVLSDGSRVSFLDSRLQPLDDEPDALDDLAAGRLSSPDDLGRILTHIRLTGRLADLIYSMEASNTDFHAFQFKPVVKILNSASKGLLIADEVGLGKTIEAGLVWKELVARYDVQRLLVVCPKSLQEKWRFELSSKFAMPATTNTASELLAILKEAETRGGDFAVVATLSGIRAPRGWDDAATPMKGGRAELAQFLADHNGGDPLFDMVVFDEAHHLRNPETAQHKTARQIVELADYKLMLSATPINLRREDLRSLLRLVEPDLFDRQSIFDELQAENEPIVAARETALASGSTLAEVAAAIAAIKPGQLLRTDRRLDILRDQLAADPDSDTPARRADIASRLWVAIEDNTVGYDVRSFDFAGEDLVPKLIEVKSTVVSPIQFFLTRNEWDNAVELGAAYHFHIWDMRKSPPVLYERTASQVAAHVPSDNLKGVWKLAQIPVHLG
jgi:SNF2-related domain/Domain of unknown function (DUF3883)